MGLAPLVPADSLDAGADDGAPLLVAEVAPAVAVVEEAVESLPGALQAAEASSPRATAATAIRGRERPGVGTVNGNISVLSA